MKSVIKNLLAKHKARLQEIEFKENKKPNVFWSTEKELLKSSIKDLEDMLVQIFFRRIYKIIFFIVFILYFCK